VDGDPLWRRLNAVRHHVRLAGSQFDVGGHVELRGYKRAASGHPHAAMVVRLAVKDVSAVGMDNAAPGDNWSHSEDHRRKQLPASPR
jgi:hypothetical protein